jgi:uncharacterized LabA/DUF88 family protein
MADETKTPQNAIVYIDGYNLYNGLKKAGIRKYLWLNLNEFASKLLLPHQTLVKTKYFTSVEKIDPKSRKRQETYFDALATLPAFNRYLGHFQNDADRWCSVCKQYVPDTREKRTDVNIATEMLVDAFHNKFDVAVLVSTDSDFVPAIRAILTYFPEKRVFSAISPKRSSKALKGVSSNIILITEKMLLDSQFPPIVKSKTGFNILQPPEWK